jgi:hypothetical protein
MKPKAAEDWQQDGWQQNDFSDRISILLPTTLLPILSP